MNVERIKEIKQLCNAFDFYQFRGNHIIFKQNMCFVAFNISENLYYFRGKSFKSFNDLLSNIMRYF